MKRFIVSILVVLFIVSFLSIATPAAAFDLPGGLSVHPYYSTPLKNVPIAVLQGEYQWLVVAIASPCANRSRNNLALCREVIEHLTLAEVIGALGGTGGDHGGDK